MKNSWAQPSLSRDFALLAAAILFILFLISSWVSYSAYTRHTARVTHDLERESARIERMISNQMENANYMLTALGRQIILDNNYDKVKIAQILKSFDSRGYIYSIFSFLNPNQEIIISSNKGVLDKPVDISDRDYVKMAATEPWKMHIGTPVEGRVSGRWVIPVVMGITDYTGKFVGSVLISIDINTLTDALSDLIRRDGLSFAIVSKTLIPLTQVSEDKDFVTNNFPIQKLVNVNFETRPSGIISEGSLFFGSSNYSYYRVSEHFPYIMLLGYDTYGNDENMRNQLWSRLMQIFGFATFFIMFLWIMRARMIRPVLDLTDIAASVANGESYKPLLQGGPVEIEGLATQIGRISDYMQETQRIEDELRNKMFMLKKNKEQAEMEKLSKSEFLAYVCQELRNPINNILGYAQVMKDQLYGPIENRKYRQGAADIYQASNLMLDNLNNLLSFAKSEMYNQALEEKPVDVATILNKTTALLSDKLHAEQSEVSIHLQPGLPKLNADEFFLQQITLNILLYFLHYRAGAKKLDIQASLSSEGKPRHFVITISDTVTKPADKKSSENDATPAEATSGRLNLELAKIFSELHQATIELLRSDDTTAVKVHFGSGRIVPEENSL